MVMFTLFLDRQVGVNRHGSSLMVGDSMKISKRAKDTLATALLAFFLIFYGLTEAGGSSADYQRARTLRQRFSGKVFRDNIDPHWVADGSMFWYRVAAGSDSYEFILVDAQNGLRRAAFDAKRMANALTDAGVANVRPEALPIEQLEFDIQDRTPRTVQFQADQRVWRCDLQTYQLEVLGQAQPESLAAIPPDRAPGASLRTGKQVYLTFVNQTDGDVELFWLDAGGQRQSYGLLRPSQERRQHTYAGHVWLVADTDGNAIAVYQAVEQPARVLIGRQTTAPRRRSDRPAGRSRAAGPDRSISPDQRWQAFIRDHNLWLRNLQEQGREQQLSTDGSPEDSYQLRVYWSPDSRKLVAIRRQPAQDRKIYFVESSPRDQLQPKLHSITYLKPGDRVAIDKPQLFDIDTQTPIPVSDALFSNPYAIFDLRWQPDSSRFTFVYNQRGHQVLRVVAVDAQTGQTSAVIEETSETFICYSQKFYCSVIDETQEMIWMSERDGWNHLYLYDAQTGTVKNQITRGQWVVRGVDYVDKDNRQIWFRLSGFYPEQDPYYVHYARINFDGSGLTLLTEGNGTHSMQFSPDRRFAVDQWSRVDQPPVHELRRCEDGKRLCVLEQADVSALYEAGWQVPEPFLAKGRDGQTDIYGLIIRPTTFDPNVSYPIIEHIYAGPQDSFVPKAFQPYLHMMQMAELGFILVQIDGMGTSNRSKAFHDVCWQNLADAGLPDRVLWIKAAAEKYPYMDSRRVGIYGGSAGGQNAAGAVMTHGDFYSVAVADCGCHDNRMDKLWWNEQWMGWPVGPHYEANSNVTLAPGLKGKLLLVVGEMDTNVDPASTMQVVNALIRADKDFELLVVPGAGHGAAETPYASRRRADFFVRHLLGVEPRHE
jgi:dipeptidyl aminopeptidase/acylaminoacyl peptidase